MNPERLEIVRGWMAKSRSDLETARLLIAGESQHLDTGAFHCQQAAEKSLKAFLASNGVIPPKTHDLVALLDMAVAFNEDLATLRDAMALLNPLGIQFRYPGDQFEPTYSEALQALHLANEVFAFVSAALTRLASDESPPSVS
jgi:HEPN domain-containing protein